jgi:mannose-1-phosphate guanylyltransferase
MDHTYAVIMAGGSGTRLWPVSRKDHPKHTLPLLGERTLFQTTVDRLTGFLPVERILVVTATNHAAALRQQAPQLPGENFLLEPEPRGTASVIGLAAVALLHRDPEAVMTILPSDHYIHNRDLFHLILRVAVEVAQKDYLVTLGITPTFPATGYGYIQFSDLLPEQFAYPVYRVLQFKEKPGETEALDMMRSGDHSWNSGMFIWKVKAILKEIARQMPKLYDTLEHLQKTWGNSDKKQAVLEKEWPVLETKTIDYGIMENAEQVAVLPASGLGWSDVGNWDSLFDVLLPDESGNIVFGGKHMGLDTNSSLVYGNGENRLVVTIGVDDLIIVDSGDVLLVCRKDQAQKVREIVARLSKEKQDRFL